MVKIYFIFLVLIAVLIFGPTAMLPASAAVQNSPLDQIHRGIAFSDITCKDNLILVIRDSGKLACITDESMKKLNWEMPTFFQSSFLDSSPLVTEKFTINSIGYSDTHFENINGTHYGTIHHTKFIDDNTLEITFQDNDFGYFSEGKSGFRSPSFEFTKTVKINDAFIAFCNEKSKYKSDTVMIFQIHGISEKTYSYHHFSGTIPKNNCNYPDVLIDSFDYDWKLMKINDSDIVDNEYH